MIASSSYAGSYSDFEVEARFARTSAGEGEGQGLIARETQTPYRASYKQRNTGYAFKLSNNGRYKVVRLNGTAEAVLKPWTASAALATGSGAYNTMRVKAQGGVLTLYLNGQQVWTRTLAHYIESGQVALAVYRAPGQASSTER